MWQRFTLYDLRVIGHYLGMLVLLFSLSMLAPLLTAIVCGEWEPAARYLWSIGIAVIIGSALCFLRVKPGRLNQQQALVVTGLSWLLLSFIAAIPMYFSGHYDTFLDTLFDCMSALTTTGVSVIEDLDHLSNADNMWRFVMQFVGGIGLIVVALSLGLFGKSSGATMYASEGRSEHLVPNLMQTSRLIIKIMVSIVCVGTVAIMLICLSLGMAPGRAFLHGLWLSIACIVTGGFAPMSQSAAYYHSFALEVVLMIIMLLGCINFVVHSEVMKGRVESFFRDYETKTMVVWACVMAFVVTASLAASGGFSDLASILRRGLFMVVSAFTTTGLSNVTSNQLTTLFSSGALLVLAVLMGVGGGSGSTSGGIKIGRLGLIAQSLVASTKQTLAPDSVRVSTSYYHVGRRILTDDVARDAMTVFALYIVTYGVGAIAGIAYGYDATQAIFESVALGSSGGLSAGIISAGMPIGLELLYMLIMWAGRLEIMTLLALIAGFVTSLNPKRWTKKA